MNAKIRNDSPLAERRSLALDGWRGLSIALVVLSHAVELPGGMNAGAGRLGMTLFFVLSGFLIAGCLERSRSPFAFLRARATRILPALILFLAAAVLVGLLSPTTLWIHLAFLTDFPAYWRDAPPGTRHLWSLCVEVHFYLVMAIGYWSGGRHFPRVFAIAFFLAAAFWAISTGYFVHSSLASRLFSCACGYLVYVVRISPQVSPLVARGAILAAFLIHLRGQGLIEGAGVLAAAFAFSALVIHRPARALAWYPLRYLGFVSYPLYLFHGLFLRELDRFRHNLPWQPVAFLAVTASLIFAHWSAHHFETYFHRRRHVG